MKIGMVIAFGEKIRAGTKSITVSIRLSCP
jgi:hypothetical protein